MNTETIEHVAGGKGHVIKHHILTKEQMLDKNSMFAKITLEPGCSIGYHVHHGDAEAYYILSGNGTYDDNGTVRPVKAGDVTFTPDGMGHSLENTGTNDLDFIALIIKN